VVPELVDGQDTVDAQVGRTAHEGREHEPRAIAQDHILIQMNRLRDA
jgi:hypothetical protein